MPVSRRTSRTIAFTGRSRWPRCAPGTSPAAPPAALLDEQHPALGVADDGRRCPCHVPHGRTLDACRCPATGPGGRPRAARSGHPRLGGVPATVSRFVPQSRPQRLEPGTGADPGVRAVHRRRDRGGDLVGQRRGWPAAGGAAPFQHRGLGGRLRARRRPALPRDHRQRAVLPRGPGPVGARSRCGRAGSGSGARSRSARSGPGSAAAGRDPAAAVRGRAAPGSRWRRASAGWATTSTRSSSAGPPTCRGRCEIDPGRPRGGRRATYHPTFLYEAVGPRGGRVLVLVDRRFGLGRGRVFALYVRVHRRPGVDRDAPHRPAQPPVRGSGSTFGPRSWSSPAGCSTSCWSADPARPRWSRAVPPGEPSRVRHRSPPDTGAVAVCAATDATERDCRAGCRDGPRPGHRGRTPTPSRTSPRAPAGTAARDAPGRDAAAGRRRRHAAPRHGDRHRRTPDRRRSRGRVRRDERSATGAPAGPLRGRGTAALNLGG